MSAFACLGELVSTGKFSVQFCWGSWCALSLTAWFMSIRFFWHMMIYRSRLVTQKHKQGHNSKQRQKKTRFFHYLMMASTLMTAISTTATLPGTLFWMHLFNPMLNEAAINSNACNYHDRSNNVSLATILEYYFGPISIWCADTSYVLILSTYFTRLCLIFDGSSFEISKLKRIIFGLMMISICIQTIIRVILQIQGAHTTVVLMWNIVLFWNVATSGYLCFNLRRQFILLIRFIPSNFRQDEFAIETGQQQREFENEGKNNIREEKENNENNVNNVNNEQSPNQTTKNDKNNNVKQLHIRHTAHVKHVEGYISLLKKFTSLAYCCLLTTVMIAIFSFLIYQVFVGYVDTKHTYIVDLIYWTFWYFDNNVNIACMSLQFDFGYNNKVYSTLCIKCEETKCVDLRYTRPKTSETSKTRSRTFSASNE